MKNMGFLLCMSLLGLSWNADAQTTSPGLWHQQNVRYDWPGIEGLTQDMILGFYVGSQNQVLRQAVNRNGQTYYPDASTGIVTFEDYYPTRKMAFVIQIQFHKNYYMILITQKGTQNSNTLSGFLALTQEEILVEIIGMSKSDDARAANAALNVSDFELARAILVAAEAYDIPILLLTALVYQESKFSVGDQSGDDDIRGPLQVSYKYAVAECENTYFKSDDFLARANINASIRPNRKTWDFYRNNILYGAAYLRYLYLQGIMQMNSVSPKSISISQGEYWKFVLVFYNAGIGEGLSAWKDAYQEEMKAGSAILWKHAFVMRLANDKDPDYQKEKRQYSPSVFFYESRLAEGERNLRLYGVSKVPARMREQYIQNFNR